MSTARVDFTRGAAERIARVVRIVEQGERDQSGPRYGRVAESGGGVGLKLCTFTGSWDINSSKTLTFKNQTATPNTVVATNLYLSLEPSTACDVLIGKAGTAWYLVQANMTQQPNYNAATEQQVFSLASGAMEWADVASCPPGNASPTSLSLFLG